MKLDEKDMALLNELQSNCRQSLKKLSRKLKMSITTVYDRMKKLEKKRVIKQYRAILDHGKTGNNITTYTLVQLNYTHLLESGENQRDVAIRLAKFPQILETHVTTGEWDIILKIRERSIKEVGDFVMSTLRKVKGVGRTHSITVWETFKETTKLKLKKDIQ
jgi:Lrp/AsnC family transcriptional regulator for asnA, asnC and gidA